MDTRAKLGKWRHLIEPELLSCATPIRWQDLMAMDVLVYERIQSVLVTYDTILAGAHVRTILVACGELQEVIEMTRQVEREAAECGIRKIMFIGRQGWLRVLGDYRKVAVIAEKGV